ncbi:hypothetical protein HC752_01550 [Vibrio sp. S9_S30]|uniref:hypothetical protein n=1 Tax=Vibrio sp. S9_S30 TaxID=2720226 RepID=UPI00168176D2|nr:hypothetical protein [Vibrio sp. S9_S30]MBD1555618.1 hypothetical protein [Vibrio sp. S9_S30]
MLARHLDCALNDVSHSKAHIEVNPTGVVAVEIHESHQRLRTEFDSLRFERKGNVTELVGETPNARKGKTWRLPLCHRDARVLQECIEDASEELEILMRDL